MIAFGVVGIALYIWCFSSTRETVERSGGRATFAAIVKMLRQNKPLIILCLATLVLLGGQFSLQTVAVYYARDVLGNADFFIWLTVVQTAGMLIAAALVPTLIGWIGKKATFVAAGFLGAIASLGVAFAPAAQPIWGIIAYGLLGIPFGLAATLIWALQADTVDYGEWKAGVRAEGASYSVLSFMRKVAQGIGGAAAAYTIGLGGYVSDAAVQSDGAVASVRIAAGGIPAVALAVAALIMLAYPLTEAVYRRIVRETAQRRAAGGESSDPAGDDRPPASAPDEGTTRRA